MTSVHHYCRENDAQLVMLVMRGSNIDDTFSEEVYNKYSDFFATEFRFNSNLIAMDFLLRPQQIVTLTGISRMAKKGCSLIVGHSKQFLEAVPSRTGSYPHLVYSTGCCTIPNYNSDRVGRIAYQDHTVGGIIVEVVDNKSFHLRPVQADKMKGFTDLGRYYNGLTVEYMSSDIVLGDAHIGSECSIAFERTVDIINLLQCKTILFNDLIDFRSVSHHEENNIKAKYNRPIHQQTLTSELEYAGKFLRNFINSVNSPAKYVAIPSNHPEHLNRYLSEGRFVFDNPFNCKLACELLPKLLEGADPLQYYFESRDYITPNEMSFPSRETPITCFGWEILHGDLGQNGAKGSLRSHDTSYEKSVSAHSHTPGIFRSSVRVGTLSKLQLSYTAGSASSWLHTNCVLYANGTYQLINIVDGKWKL
jgi:hypothetical protein